MIIIGLTGSIGMGKTTTAKFFADAGIPVQNADEVVHVLYQGDGAALIEEAFPNTVINGKVDRQALGKKVLGNKAALKQLENIVHPLVQKAREEFIEEHKAKKTPMVLLDIPLLFETGLDKHCDVIVVVSTNEEIQKERVLARPNMSEEKFQKILDKQLPDEQKREKADYIIDTSNSLEDAKKQVLNIIKKLTDKVKS